MQAIRVSIIIASYNASRTIERCLRSISSQTLKPIEVILIDGASTDETIEIFRSFKFSCSKVVSERDRGVYEAWNKGTSIASGQWITFIGADDEFSGEDSLEALWGETQSDRPFIYGCTDTYEPNGRFVGRHGGKFRNPFGLVHNFVRSQFPFPIMGTLYNRSFLGDARFDESLQVTSDMDLVLGRLRKWDGLPPFFLRKVVVNMATGGISTRSDYALLVMKEARLVRQRNGLSNVNLGLMTSYFVRYVFAKMDDMHLGGAVYGVRRLYRYLKQLTTLSR